MGDNQVTSTSTTGSASPQFQNTINKFASSVGDTFSKPFGNRVYEGTAYKFIDPQIESIYSPAITGALQTTGDIAQGNRMGENAPGYAQLRQNTIDDAIMSANSPFLSSGTFGSDMHRKMVGEGVGNAIAGLDYANYGNDIARMERAQQNLPGFYSAAQLPGQSRYAAERDLYERRQNADLNFLGQVGSVAGINAGSAGTTTTQSQPTTPWWQSALGYSMMLI